MALKCQFDGIAPSDAAVATLFALEGSIGFLLDQSHIFAELIAFSHNTRSLAFVLDPKASKTMSLIDASFGTGGL